MCTNKQSSTYYITAPITLAISSSASSSITLERMAFSLPLVLLICPPSILFKLSAAAAARKVYLFPTQCRKRISFSLYLTSNRGLTDMHIYCISILSTPPPPPPPPPLLVKSWLLPRNTLLFMTNEAIGGSTL